MKQFFTILVFSTFLFNISKAQETKTPTLVYQITAEEVKNLYPFFDEHDDKKLLKAYQPLFYNLVDSSENDITVSRPHFKEGYYLKVHADGEELKVELIGILPLNVKMISDNAILIFQVFDSLHFPITDAQLIFEDKIIPFDDATQSYQIKKRKQEGLLTIIAHGDTVLYALDRRTEYDDYFDHPETFWEHLGFPFVRFGVTWWRKREYKLKKFYRNIDEQITAIRYDKEWLHEPKWKKVKGYVATNQPKYRHHDTVRVKAYITTRRGRPRTQPMVFAVYDKYIEWEKYHHTDLKPIFSTVVYPDKKGNYTYDFVLGDSLKLDKRYNIYFLKNTRGKRHRIFMREEFYLEDYELENVKYSLIAPSFVQHEPNEKFIIRASATDQNGNFIPDGMAELSLVNRSIDKFYTDEVIVRDTVWQITTPLKSNGETQILVPWEAIPPIKGKYVLISRLYNSNGEGKSDIKKLEINNLNEYIKIEQDSIYITAEYWKDGQLVTTSGELKQYLYKYSNKYKTRNIQFPFKEKINPYCTKYTFSKDDIYKTKSSKSNEVIWSGGNTGDSIFIFLENLNAVPVGYELYKVNELIERGTITKKYWQHIEANRSGKTYSVKYFYPNHSKIEINYEHYPYYKDKLNIEIEQPNLVIPGQNVPVSVKVTNAKDKPVKSVDLTAFAVNSALEGEHDGMIARHRRVRYKKYGKNKGYYNFDAVEAHDETLPLDSTWMHKMSLKEELYYRVRFPENGLLMEYTSLQSDEDTFYNNIAQFAPYIVKDGKMQTIHLIYSSGRVVYYQKANETHPYAFPVKEGIQTIEIRTTDASYVIDSVVLKKGMKLELSIDENNYKKSHYSAYITKTAKPNELTVDEISTITSNFMILNSNRTLNYQYLWQDDDNIHLVKSNYDDVVVGPFRNNQPIHYSRRYGFSKTMKFEGGFRYEIEENRERLYKNTNFIYSNKLYNGYKPYYSATRKEYNQHVGQKIHHPSIKKDTFSYDFISDLIYFESMTMDVVNDYDAKYQLDFEPNKSNLAMVWINEGQPAWIMHYNRKASMPAGNYKVLIFNYDSTYYEINLPLKAYETFCWRINKIPELRTDTNLTLLKKYYSDYKDAFDRTYTTNNSISMSYTPRVFFGGKVITGQITDVQTGEPMIGATVNVKGTSQVTTTDANGFYSLEMPKGRDVLTFASTGFSTQNIRITDENPVVNIALMEGKELDELVVVGYSSPLVRMDNTTQGKSISYAVSRRDAFGGSTNVVVRGNTSVKDSEPLYIVDGIVVENPTDIDADDITSVEVLKDASATAIYGARAAAGVVIISTKKGKLFSKALTTSQLRTNFRDYAYWQPNLITDQNGEAHFNVKFPDNITQWNTIILGMDKKGHGGRTTTQTKSYKPVMGQLAIPRFLVTGDEVDIIGKSVNYTNDSFNITTTFKQENTILQTNQSLLIDGIIENTRIKAPMPTDSLKLSYRLKTNDFGDGEERSIPVLSLGVKESNGYFYAFNSDTTIQFTFDNSKNDIVFFAQSDIIDVLLEDLKYLKEYPYDCNEQTASRLMALIMEENIKKQLGERCNNSIAIKKMISRLEKAQNEDGSFGWWKGGEANRWMTAYVLKALYLADQNNYYTYHPMSDARDFLTETSTYEILNRYRQLDIMSLEVDIKKTYTHKDDLVLLDTTKLSLYKRMQLIKVQQNAGVPYDLDTLIRAMHRTTFGGYYWGKEGYHWNINSIPMTLMAYEIFKKAGREDICKGIRQYFLEKRQHNGWRNTFETAQILYTILPDILEDDKKLEKSQLIINGGAPISLDEPIFKANFSNTKTITIEKKGNTPVFVTAFQSFQNTNPKPKKDLFEVTTQFIQGKKVSDKKNIQVAKNQPLTLQATVEVKEAADYVMIEIPIPAGCSYTSKRSGYGFEVHREHFKDKVSIFCEQLPVGTYTFDIQLETRYAGDFTLNPAKVEQMYFPIFYGRNAIKKVEISSAN